MLFSNELDKRYGSQGIVSISLHPGNLKTDLQRHGNKLEACLTVGVWTWCNSFTLTLTLWTGSAALPSSSRGLYPTVRRDNARG